MSYKTPRPPMPGKTAIKAAWAFYLLEIDKFDSMTELWEPQQKEWRDDQALKGKDYCWACGMTERVERAHILAYAEGGSSDVENLHLLCGDCHEASELLKGDEYFDWLVNRTVVDRMMERAARDMPGGWTSARLKGAAKYA